MAKIPPRSQLAPFVTVLRCKTPPPAPPEYIGHWPEADCSYIVDVFATENSNEPRIYMPGLVARVPYDSLPIAGWQYVATIWLN